MAAAEAEKRRWLQAVLAGAGLGRGPAGRADALQRAHACRSPASCNDPMGHHLTALNLPATGRCAGWPELTATAVAAVGKGPGVAAQLLADVAWSVSPAAQFAAHRPQRRALQALAAGIVSTRELDLDDAARDLGPRAQACPAALCAGGGH